MIFHLAKPIATDHALPGCAPAQVERWRASTRPAMRRGGSKPARVATRDRLARARGRSERKPPGTLCVHVTPALAAQVQVSRVELNRSRWVPALESKSYATRDVTGYGEPLRDIVLPNEGVRQVANRQGERAQNGLTQYATRTGAKRGRAHTWEQVNVSISRGRGFFPWMLYAVCLIRGHRWGEWTPFGEHSTARPKLLLPPPAR